MSWTEDLRKQYIEERVPKGNIKAKCSISFPINRHDDNGHSMDNLDITIDKGTIWDVEEEDFRDIGGDIRLTNNDLVWIEIPIEIFVGNFKVLN